MKPKEYEAFEEALERVLSVPHTEIKQQEAARKAVRQKAGFGKKRKIGAKPSASRRASNDKG